MIMAKRAELEAAIAEGMAVIDELKRAKARLLAYADGGEVMSEERERPCHYRLGTPAAFSNRDD
jgi:hypothetical protein